MAERNYDGVGSPSDLPSLDRNVGSWGKSGSRFRATGGPFVATSGSSHPDETFVGRIEKDFDFLDYHFGPDGLSVAKNTV